MHIARLYIEHFGVFRNERVEDLHKGLVIVEGPNRAGKTTLMRLLRFLPFGFSGTDLPSATRSLKAEADVVNEAGRYRVELQGKRPPRVTPLDQAPEIDPDALAGGLTDFTYWQVFTISLDELRAEPLGIKSTQRKDLQTVLLGHGWADALKLPQAGKLLADVADGIGASKGSAREIGAVHEALKQAVADRDKALERVPLHREARQALEARTGDRDTADARVAEQRARVRRLELVADHFSASLELAGRSRQLAEAPDAELLSTFPARGQDDLQRVRADLAEREQALDQATVELTVARGAGADADLLAAGETIDRLNAEASGLRAQCDQWRQQRDRLALARRALEADVRRLFPDSAEGLGVADRVRVNLITHDQVRTAVARREAARRALEAHQAQLAELEAKHTSQAEELERLRPDDDADDASLDDLNAQRDRLAGWLDLDGQHRSHTDAAAQIEQTQERLRLMQDAPLPPHARFWPWLALTAGAAVGVALGLAASWLAALAPLLLGPAAAVGLGLFVRGRRQREARIASQLAADDQTIAEHRQAAGRLAERLAELARASNLPTEADAEQVRTDQRRVDTRIAEAARTSSERGQRELLQNNLKKLAAEIEAHTAGTPAVEGALADADAAFAELVRSLGLPAEVRPATVETFVSDAQKLVEGIDRFRAEAADHDELGARLRPRLQATAAALAGVKRDVAAPAGGWLGAEAALFDRLKQAKSDLDKAREFQTRVDEARRQVEAIKAQVQTARDKLAAQVRAGLPDQVEAMDAAGQTGAEPEWVERFEARAGRAAELNAWRREADDLRNGLLTALGAPASAQAIGADQREPDALLAAFEAAASPFATPGEAEQALAGARAELQAAEQAQGELQNECGRLEGEIKRLAADTELRDAQHRIEQNRERLAELARRYAMHRLAANLVGEVHRRCVAEAHGPILQAATDSFERLTGGAYEEILTSDDADKPGFTVKPSDAKGAQAPGVLSRATAEQLFLAVRLSRIRSIDTPLPVVIDDSLVNFDPEHRESAMRLIGELVSTHQVFLMTCHPEMAARARAAVPDAQHWKLDNGHMTLA